MRAAANDNALGVPLRPPVPIPVLTEVEQRRFWREVDARDGAEACWPWRGAAEPYGRVKIRGKLYLAHRVAFAITNGSEAADGVVVRHSCDNPPCCNPAHLVAGTYSDNTEDMLVRGRANPRRGEDHPFAAANDNLVREIRASKMSGRKAAEHFGVSYGMVANIRAGRSWRHVA